MKNTNFKTQSSKSGFTLVEMLLVVALIGTLGAVALPQLLDYRQEAKEAYVSAVEQSIGTAIKLQTHNTILRCGKTFGDFPTLESLVANDITAGGDCSSSVLSEFDSKFVTTDVEYPPVNPLNGLSTIGLASYDPDQATFQSGKCSTDSSSTDFGWCYNPQTGSFWAATNNNTDPCAGDVDPAYCGSSSSVIVSSSSSSVSVSSSSVSSEPPVSSSSSVSSVVPPVSSSSSSVSSVVSSSSSSVPASSSSSESSVASSSSSSTSSTSSASSVGGGGGGGSGGSSSSSSSSSSSVASSSSSTSSVASSSSAAGVTLYSTCESVPADQRVRVSDIISGAYELPDSAIYTQGNSEKVCTCKTSGSGFTKQSPSLTAVFNGVGHQNSFFLLGTACK